MTNQNDTTNRSDATVRTPTTDGDDDTICSTRNITILEDRIKKNNKHYGYSRYI